MSGNLRNLIHVLRRYKVAAVVNILGLSLAFTAFMVVLIHVRYEYGFDKSIPDLEYIFQVENLRGDGIWESNWARPQIERFMASSPYIESAGLMNGLGYSSFEFGFATSRDPGTAVHMYKMDRIRPEFLDVFGVEFIMGSTENFRNYGTVLIPGSLAKELYGDEDPVGKSLFPNEFKGIPGSGVREGKEVFEINGLELDFENVIGGVYRDFPENTRLKNVIFGLIPESEQMDDWYTGQYYCFMKLTSPDMAEAVTARYMADNKEELIRYFDIHDIRLRPLDGLYFSQPVRADSAPYGNKLATDMLLLIGILIIIIALINYVNFSVALAPARIKAVNTRKVLGCSQSSLRINLISESLGISLLAFSIAVILVSILGNGNFLSQMMGHSLALFDNRLIVALTALISAGAGIAAGVYPAFYMTSFPPAMAINGSYALTGRARATRKILIGFQYVISIALIIGAIFISLQNHYIRNTELGFDKEMILEVRIGLGTALTQNTLYRELALQHPDILDLAYGEFKFLTDENQSLIGYNYRNGHAYMAWRGVSPNFPEVMGIEIIAGRNFRTADEERDDDKAVAVINETAARDIMAMYPGELTDFSQIIGTNIRDNNHDVEIIGIARDFHHQSLYRKIEPYAFWVSARGHYRRHMPENFSYVKIRPGDPSGAIEHIKQVIDRLEPGYPADVRFFDETMERLYGKSRNEGLMVTVFSLLAIIISLVGVFGLVIFESQRREKEIAVRKVFGAGVSQILVMFNSGFMKIVLACFLIAAPLAWFAVGKWLQNFAYKTPMHAWVFIAAVACIALLTMATVTFQSYRTATENPARKLHR